MPPESHLEARLAEALAVQAKCQTLVDAFHREARHSTPDNKMEERRREAELKAADNDVLRLRLELKDEETRRLLARQEQRDRDAVNDRKEMKAELEVHNQRTREHYDRVIRRSNIAIVLSVLALLVSTIGYFTRQ